MTEPELDSLAAIGAAYDQPMRDCPGLWAWEDHCATRVLKADPEIDGQVLDIGSGTGGIAVWLARAKPTLTLSLVEPSAAGREIAHRDRPADVADRITDHAGIAAALPFPDATFDAAYSSHVFEHIADHTPALTEIRRVLKPGAPLLLLVPAGEAYACATHVHHWTLGEFAAHLAPYAPQVETWEGPEQQLIARLRFF